MTTAALPSWIDQPGPGALWHLTAFGAWAAQRGARAVLAPAANRRVPTGPLPVVAVVHDLAALRVRGKYDALRTAYARRMVLPALARARHLVAISEATRKDLSQLLRRPSSDITVVPNGIDTQRFHPGVTPHESPSPYLIYVSRLEHPGKNHLRLLEAFAVSRASRTHRLILAGDDWGGRALLERTVAERNLTGRVVFAGRVGDDDLPALVAGADAAIMVGLHEGFGLPVLEALACGVPILVATAGALPEVAGPLGARCDPLDVASIARGLDAVCSDEPLRAQARSLGPAHARRFSWDSTAHNLATLCLDAAA